jgi:N-acylneuraminate cytidylyltransferase
MIYGKSVLAIIPARGGSKGLPGKNIRLLKDKPLIAWSIELAQQCDYIDALVVSTDDPKIAQVAADFGARPPFMRPAELATDTAGSRDVLLHALEQEDQHFDLVVLLQPTTPLRTMATLTAAIELCAETSKTVISVSENSKPLAWMFYREEHGIRFVVKDGISNLARRQVHEPVYYVDGNVYCWPIEELLNRPALFDENTLTVVSGAHEAVDIDTIHDFHYCEFLIKE